MTVMDIALYERLAGLLDQPREDIKLKTEECVKTLAQFPQYTEDVGTEMRRFQKDIEEMPLDDLQGIYSYTFELSADYSLDMGYHLYDGFKRANNLSLIKTMYKDTGFPFDEIAKGELPDHLPVVLRFMGFSKDAALIKSFREDFVIKALEKLHKNFDKTTRNPYRHLIGAIYRIIDKDVKEEVK